MVKKAVRKALLQHALLSGAVIVITAALVVFGSWLFAKADAEAVTERAAGNLAIAVIGNLANHDYTAIENFSSAELDNEITGFIESGIIYRVKVWKVSGDQVQVVYSDEPEIIGDSRKFSPELAQRLDNGEVVILEVPNNFEHRFEAADRAELREVFIGFKDRVGNPMRLEVYVPVYFEKTMAKAMTTQLGIVLPGMLLLGLALLPISLIPAKKIARLAEQRKRMLEFSLKSADDERRKISQLLHDEVIPTISAAGLLGQQIVQQSGSVTESNPNLGQLLQLQNDSITQLRGILEGFIPTELVESNLPIALAELCKSYSGEKLKVSFKANGVEQLSLDPNQSIVLYRAAQELLRNVAKHSKATQALVLLDYSGADPTRAQLLVADNGTGFNPASFSTPGHVGLLLVRESVADLGGSFQIISPAVTTQLVESQATEFLVSKMAEFESFYPVKDSGQSGQSGQSDQSGTIVLLQFLATL